MLFPFIQEGKVLSLLVDLGLACAKVPAVSSASLKEIFAAEPGIRSVTLEEVKGEAIMVEVAAKTMFHNILDVEARENKTVGKGNWSSTKIAAKFSGESSVGKGPFMQLAAAFVAGTCCFTTSETNTALLKKLVNANQRLLDFID